MNLLTRICVSVLFLGLSGCVSQVEKDYRESQNNHFRNQDVATAMEQRAALEFPAVHARVREAFDSGKSLVTPKVISSVAPKYPTGKVFKGVQSGVWVAFVVSETGIVAEARHLVDEAMPADPALVESALAAVRQWKFSPATIEGRPMKFILCVPVLFELRGV